MQQHDEDTQEINCDMSPTIDFDQESYLTPRRSVRDYSSSIDPPLLPRRRNPCDRDEYEIKRNEEEIVRQMTFLHIPLIGSKRPPLSPKKPSFVLPPKRECGFTSPPRIERTHTLRNTQESHVLFYKDSPLFESIQANTMNVYSMERRRSFTAMSAQSTLAQSSRH